MVKLDRSSKRALALAVVAVALVWGGVAWRLWARGEPTLQGKMREGSLRCDDACHFELVLEVQGGTRVRSDTCIMPDTLRDFPGHPVEVLVAGPWEGERRLKATFMATQGGYWGGPKPSSGRPPACFVPSNTR